MISLKDYARADATQLAAWVRAGEVSTAELAEAALSAIERLNPTLNAVLQVFPEGSGPFAPDGPFAGVPFLIKELVLHAAGVRCDSGSRLSQGFVAEADTELMARFRRAGLRLLGTTQTPEFGYNPTTETTLFGPVHNPWNLDHSAGGSSGGSGAAVAAGIVPVAHANDGGGSIRIPASCNGLVGLKPSRDRVPQGPDMADALCGWAAEFVVARSVRDVATLLDGVAGPDVGAPGVIASPPRPYRDELGAEGSPLRVAWTTTSASGEPVAPECARAVERTAEVLESLGHEISEAAPSVHWEEFMHHNNVVWTAFVAHGVDGTARVMGRGVSPENLEAVTLACVEEGRRYSAQDLLAALDYGNVLARETGRFHERYDVLVTPTMATEPVPLGAIDQDDASLSAMQWTEKIFRYCAFTPLFNITGQPAVSLPLHQSGSGLPVGVQCVARLGDESTLIRLASQLEEALPWRDRVPPHHASSV